MTFRAGNCQVPPGQRKGKNIMGEIIPEVIYSIMTVKTCLTKSDGMLDHERHVDLTVTLTTGNLIKGKGGDVILVTIIAQERLPLRRQLVTV